MFGYSEDVLNGICTNLETTSESLRAEVTACRSQAETLRAEAESLRAQAETLRAEAESLRAQAASLKAQASALRSKQEWKTVSRTVTDPETGESRSESETVRDYAAEAANRAQADSMDAQAAQMEAQASQKEAEAVAKDAEAVAKDAEAAALDALAAGLEASASAIDGQVQSYRTVMTTVETMIIKTKETLNTGINKIENAISKIELPEMDIIEGLGTGIINGVMNAFNISEIEKIADEIYGKAIWKSKRISRRWNNTCKRIYKWNIRNGRRNIRRKNKRITTNKSSNSLNYRNN